MQEILIQVGQVEINFVEEPATSIILPSDCLLEALKEYCRKYNGDKPVLWFLPTPKQHE